ncbi:alpha/beta hydrolase [Hungatella hathewayi]|uniref:alpha/beta fold hydrolase n=1 Tax=Hungatella hathewayi TaxID=154046 RepID=UPI00210E7899|nr:alpha/beta hydrolase [Hungatella hathewayi]MCQ5383954.1 alpha/beta hydrolase [Hungatella hathewayi]
MKYIFIHGLGQGPDSWNKTVSCMREQEEIQCLSVFALKNWEEISYRRVYEDFSAYCESVKTELGLCGLSLGAVIALNYVVEHPGKVKSLVLIGGQCVMPKGLLRLQNMIFRLMPNGIFKKMGIGKRELIQLTKSMMVLDFKEDLEKVDCRTLIVCGEKDRANRRAAEIMAEKIPGARIKILEGCGHEVNVEDPEKLADILEAFYEEKQAGNLTEAVVCDQHAGGD